MNTGRDEAERIVQAQARVCDERAKRFESAVLSIEEMKTTMNAFIAESKEHRRTVEMRLDDHGRTLYGDGSDGNKGIAGDCILMREQIGGVRKIINRGAAAIIGVLVTGLGGWGTAAWQWWTKGKVPTP